MNELLTMLKELTECSGVPGHEVEVRQVIRKHVAPYTEITQDRLGSIICMKKGVSEEPRIMLAGHMDEIGFMVTHITKEGYLKFQQLGGWWDQVLMSQRVIVKTRKGDVLGVIGSKPPHLMDAEERRKMVKKEDMYIDVGASSREEVQQFGVRPGDPVVPASDFSVMTNPKYLLAKAWDDRVGCALFIETIKRLGQDHPNTVYGVGTVQEEVGLRGAATSSYVVQPHVSFALEVSIANDTPGVAEHEGQIKLGGGPAILVYDASLVPNARLRDLVIDTAQEEGISVQFGSMSAGGTDAGRIQLTSAGVPSLVIGVPTRYIHSHQGIVQLDDFENTVRLMVATIKKLDSKTVEWLVE